MVERNHTAADPCHAGHGLLLAIHRALAYGGSAGCGGWGAAILLQALAAADEQEVMSAWQGLGYYSRARNLYKSAQMIVERGWAPFPTRFEDIRSLPGIGDYTAGAIAAFAYDMPYPAMDGNVYRVVARLFDIEEAFDTSAGKRLFHECIETILDRAHPGLFDEALMELGALHCTPTLTDTETGELRHSCYR